MQRGEALRLGGHCYRFVCGGTCRSRTRGTWGKPLADVHLKLGLSFPVAPPNGKFLAQKRRRGLEARRLYGLSETWDEK